MSSAASAPSTSTDVALYDTAMFPDLLDQDPAAVNARFAERYSRAKTIEDLFAVLEGTASKDMVGRSLEVLDVAWAPYEADDGIIPLAICSARDLSTGEVVEFATTSLSMTLFIRQAQLIKEIPFQARITSKKTRSGQTALNFERV